MSQTRSILHYLKPIISTQKRPLSPLNKSEKIHDFTEHNHNTSPTAIMLAYWPTDRTNKAHTNTKKRALKKRHAKIFYIDLVTSLGFCYV